jgi:hypothetical protein
VAASVQPLTEEPSVNFPRIVTAACLYRDSCGWLSAASAGDGDTYCVVCRHCPPPPPFSFLLKAPGWLEWLAPGFGFRVWGLWCSW